MSKCDFYAETSKQVKEIETLIQSIWEEIWNDKKIILKKKQQKFAERFEEKALPRLLEMHNLTDLKNRNISYPIFALLKILNCNIGYLSTFAKTLSKKVGKRDYFPEIPQNLARKNYVKLFIDRNNRVNLKESITNFKVGTLLKLLKATVEFDNPSNLPFHSTYVQIKFTLKKPFTSKDDEFYIIDNPIVKDKLLKLPMVRSTTWKGALKSAARLVNWENGEEKKKILLRLFGNEKEEQENFREGRLFFYSTFFEEISLDVLTPLSRETKTPVRGPIYFEIVRENAEGIFRLFYYPFDLVARGNVGEIESEAEKDLSFLAEALKKMFYEVGFSAKKTSGFGVVTQINDNDVRVDGFKSSEVRRIIISKLVQS